jgi:hypothetical protein
VLRNLIEENQRDFNPFPEPFHVELLELLKNYYLTGGMPEAISTYVQTSSFQVTRQVQQEIIDSYRFF